eukprot:2702725-Pyramimonas_sp.AAC.1
MSTRDPGHFERRTIVDMVGFDDTQRLSSYMSLSCVKTGILCAGPWVHAPFSNTRADAASTSALLGRSVTSSTVGTTRSSIPTLAAAMGAADVASASLPLLVRPRPR